MPVFQKIDIVEIQLPIIDQNAIQVCKNRRLDFLLSSSIYDSYMIQGKDILSFLVPVTTYQIIKAIDVVCTYAPLEDEITLAKNLDLWITTDLFIKGSIYLDGKIVVKGKDILVGVYSYQEHKNGYIWGHELRNRCVSL